MHKITSLVLVTIALACTACNSRTTDTETRELTYQLDRNEPSAMFWDYAASTSLLQKELGALAKQKTSDPRITALADSMLYIHTNALHRLVHIAKKYKHVQLPDSLTGADSTTVEDFKQLEGEEFTARYLEYLEQSSTTQLERYNETLSETEDPALRSWLNTMRARLSSQLQAYTAFADTVTEDQ
ncbi:DUF4142 domain-containing protein [Pontibacter sp. Tf4]|uniref:DUF4142 domain-containing protein n=1 Tax=Pontibacter sp. Tf4 TaxID=2761620 RepID=UPI001628781F|nr:DUF4142 domain-containing protein [Pontibacter sp. Tf4]MBB6609935.1 DUF4142 domain-containing protein [Pontibacter sp. Tf4]